MLRAPDKPLLGMTDQHLPIVRDKHTLGSRDMQLLKPLA
jgi:hypothetical protein